MEPGLVLSDMHSIGGGGFFDSAAAGGDRRLRPHRNDNQNHQTLKCPRCDSPNTKFCYYNNYNLSQPRHFCRSCRRYWTKGGVLRNVPVGGGCRKTMRSKLKNSPSPAATTVPPPAPSSAKSKRERKTSNSDSSSENSSLTAAVATEAVSVSAPSSNSTSNNLLDNLHDSILFVHSSSQPSSDPGVTEQGVDSGIFSEIENLTSLITPTNETFGYGNITDASSFQMYSQWQKGMSSSDHRHQDLKWPEMTTSLMEQTVVAAAGDWQENTDDQGLFDVGNTVDESVWSHNQWNEDNNSRLFHLP